MRPQLPEETGRKEVRMPEVDRNDGATLAFIENAIAKAVFPGKTVVGVLSDALNDTMGGRRSVHEKAVGLVMDSEFVGIIETIMGVADKPNAHGMEELMNLWSQCDGWFDGFCFVVAMNKLAERWAYEILGGKE